MDLAELDFLSEVGDTLVVRGGKTLDLVMSLGQEVPEGLGPLGGEVTDGLGPRGCCEGLQHQPLHHCLGSTAMGLQTPEYRDGLQL
jgi:hypothetical protein